MLYVCAALQIGYSFNLLIRLGVLYLLPEHRRNSNLPDIGLQHRPAGGPQIRRELIYPYPLRKTPRKFCFVLGIDNGLREAEASGVA